MSLETYVHIGAYALITHPPVKQMIRRFGCPEHKSVDTGRFCPLCGTEFTTVEQEQISQVDLIDLLPGTEAFFQPRELISIPTNTIVAIGNLTGVKDRLNDGDDVLPITQAEIERCINAFETGYAHELQILKERAESVTIHFGMITHSM